MNEEDDELPRYEEEEEEGAEVPQGEVVEVEEIIVEDEPRRRRARCSGRTQAGCRAQSEKSQEGRAEEKG